MIKISNLLRNFFSSPLLWGILGSIGFYGLIYGGPLDFPIIRRYFSGHPVEYMEAVLFSIGLAALILKGLDIASQRIGLSESMLGPKTQATETIETCQNLLRRMNQLPPRRSEEFLCRRLRAALEHVCRRGTADALNDELKYLSDMDASRLHAGLGLFRVILWAIPILGFLGTVVGITMALNSVDLKSPDQSMLQVLNGLGLKFDTTAVALSLSMVLMFVHFFVDRSFNGFLEQLDRRAEEELAGRFLQVSSAPEGQLLIVRRMAETMIQMTERLVQRQAELWQGSMEAAAARWAQMSKAGGEQLQHALAGALAEGLKIHAQHLTAGEQAFIQANRQHWEKTLLAQAQSMQNLGALQATVTRQSEVLERTVAAVGEVARLEEALNRNLSALAGATHFEQTIASLAAAINLLHARMADLPAPTAIKLDPNRRVIQAA